MCNAMLNLSVTASTSREEERGRSLPLFFLVRRLSSPTLVRNCSFESSKTISPPLSDCYMLQGGYENKSDVGGSKPRTEDSCATSQTCDEGKGFRKGTTELTAE